MLVIMSKQQQQLLLSLCAATSSGTRRHGPDEAVQDGCHARTTIAYLCCDLEAAVSYEGQHASLWSPQSKPQSGPYRPAY